VIKVIRFTAPWCAPCRMLAPVFKQLEQELSDVTFETVNIDETPDVATTYSVRSIPTVIVFKNDMDVISLTGAGSKRQYMDMIQEARDA